MLLVRTLQVESLCCIKTSKAVSRCSRVLLQPIPLFSNHFLKLLELCEHFPHSAYLAWVTVNTVLEGLRANEKQTNNQNKVISKDVYNDTTPKSLRSLYRNLPSLDRIESINRNWCCKFIQNTLKHIMMGLNMHNDGDYMEFSTIDDVLVIEKYFIDSGLAVSSNNLNNYIGSEYIYRLTALYIQLRFYSHGFDIENSISTQMNTYKFNEVVSRHVKVEETDKSVNILYLWQRIVQKNPLMSLEGLSVNKALPRTPLEWKNLIQFRTSMWCNMIQMIAKHNGRNECLSHLEYNICFFHNYTIRYFKHFILTLPLNDFRFIFLFMKS